LVEILKQWERSHPNWDRLPAIVPFVFYHDLDEWKIPDEFLPLVDTEQGWRPYLFNFRFPVLDLGRSPDRALSADHRLQAQLLTMKYATRKAQQMAIQGLLIEALRRTSEGFRPIIHYLIQVYCYDEQTLRHIIHEVRPEEETTMMSQLAQDIRREVLQENIQQGMQQGREQGIQQGCATRYPERPVGRGSQALASDIAPSFRTLARRDLRAGLPGRPQNYRNLGRSCLGCRISGGCLFGMTYGGLEKTKPPGS